MLSVIWSRSTCVLFQYFGITNAVHQCVGELTTCQLMMIEKVWRRVLLMAYLGPPADTRSLTSSQVLCLQFH